jgi:hypothetical protein
MFVLIIIIITQNNYHYYKFNDFDTANRLCKLGSTYKRLELTDFQPACKLICSDVTEPELTAAVAAPFLNYEYRSRKYRAKLA